MPSLLILMYPRVLALLATMWINHPSHLAYYRMLSAQLYTETHLLNEEVVDDHNV